VEHLENLSVFAVPPSVEGLPSFYLLHLELAEKNKNSIDMVLVATHKLLLSFTYTI